LKGNFEEKKIITSVEKFLKDLLPCVGCSLTAKILGSTSISTFLNHNTKNSIFTLKKELINQ